MKWQMKSKVIILTAIAVISCALFVRKCSQYDTPTAIRYQTVQDTITTFVTETKVDTVIIRIEQRLDSVMNSTETKVKEVIEKEETLKVRIVELKKLDRITLYDTVKTILRVPSDSITLYNIFEYESTDGLEVLVKRDTIQSRRVSRAYAQRYIMN